ncbi:hypothetical protein EOM33_04360 [Candidatus Saccharibacteria bacterium]|nr:hypothetical protein [Candidatus Saccharibacteria bacterium]
MFPKTLDTLLMPRLAPDVKTFFGMSSLIKSGLRTTDPGVEQKIDKLLNEPLFTLSDLDKKYRTINYLEQTGLIDDTRGEKGKGWRKLGLSEYIYISILLELRKYGLKSNHLKHFKSLYDEYFILAIFAVLAGHEITMIFKPNGFCALLDPTFLSIYEEEDERFMDITPRRDAGEIQLKLSYFTSNALALINKPTPVIHYSYAKSASTAMAQKIEALREYEKQLLKEVEQLDYSKDEHLLVQRLKDRTLLIKRGERLPNDSDLASQLNSLVDEGFCDLKVTKRDGKVVDLVQTNAKKLNMN